MILKIVAAALFFVWGVLTLFGVFDKWLLYGDSKAIEEERKQINIKQAISLGERSGSFIGHRVRVSVL